MEWGQPHHFVWFWAVGAAAGLFLLASWRKKRELARFGDPVLIGRLVQALDKRMRVAKRALVLTALCLMVIALAQPHFRKKETLVERMGVDVLIAIDVSNSMLSRDIAPSRLEKAKLELTGLVNKLRGDRIGILAFAGEAFIQCPLTLDRSAVKLFLSTVNPNLVTLQGTSLSAAIEGALKAFPKEKGGKSMILLTDGEDHEGDIAEAAKRATKAGVKIYTIGIGTPDGRTIQLADGSLKKDRAGRPVLSKLDEGVLKAIAKETGGRYYRSSRGELEIDAIARELKGLAQKGFQNEWSIEYEENYQPFLLLAFLLLLFEMAVSERTSKNKEKSAGAAALILILLPFLTGFDLLSRVKNEQGNGYYKKGQVGKARTAYLEAQKGSPASPEIAFNLGNAYYKEESLGPSLENYKKAAESGAAPQLRSRAYYNLGNVLARKNDIDRAIEAYKSALRLDPKDADSKFNLELLTKKKKEEEKKKQDRKKDDQKKDDQKKDQQQDQKKDQQGQGGGEGDKQEDQKSQGGQGEQDKKDQKGEQDKKDQQGEQEQKDQQGGEGQDKKEESQGQQGQDEKEAEAQKEKEAQAQQAKEEAEQEKERQAEEAREAQGQAGKEGQDGEEKKDQPKTAGELRAEQLLEALENQEKQVLRMAGGTNGPQRGVPRRVNEKDW